MFNDISEVKSLLEIEAMELDEAQNYLLKAKAQFSTLSLIRYWKTNSKYIYGKVYKKYNIPTSGNMIKINKQTKWQEENERKLTELIDTPNWNMSTIPENPKSCTPLSKIEEKSDFPTYGFDIIKYLNSNFKSEKIANFSPEKEGLIIVLDSGSRIKIGPLSNAEIKLDVELSAVYTI